MPNLNLLHTKINSSWRINIIQKINIRKIEEFLSEGEKKYRKVHMLDHEKDLFLSPKPPLIRQTTEGEKVASFSLTIFFN